MKLLAIDPGERVGWATATIVDGEFKVTKHGISHLKDFAITLGERIGSYDTVVYETFKLSAKGARVMIGSDLQTAQLVGMIRYLAWLHPTVKLVSQAPAIKTTAEKTMPPWLREKVEALPKAHDDSHDGDALLHAWMYYWKRFV